MRGSVDLEKLAYTSSLSKIRRFTLILILILLRKKWLLLIQSPIQHPLHTSWLSGSFEFGSKSMRDT